MLRSRHPLGQGLPVIKPSSGATEGRARSPLGRIRGDTERFRPFMTVHARGPWVRSRAYRKAHTAPFGRDRPSRRDGNGLSARHPDQPVSAPWIRGRARRPVRQVSDAQGSAGDGLRSARRSAHSRRRGGGRRPTVHADDQHRRPACRPVRTVQAPVRAVSDNAPCGLRTRVAAAGRARGGKCPARRPPGRRQTRRGTTVNRFAPAKSIGALRSTTPLRAGPRSSAEGRQSVQRRATRAHRADDRLRHPRTGAVRVPDAQRHRTAGTPQDLPSAGLTTTRAPPAPSAVSSAAGVRRGG